jgi:cyclopropane-fatty-acyl-phospholipid synthase
VLLALMARWLQRVSIGSIDVTLPLGTRRRIGRPGTGPAADIALRSYDVLWRSLRRGALGFAESHIDGAWQSSDLGNVFRYFLANQHTLKASDAGLFRIADRDRRYHRSRANTREGSKRNITEHYDLGNAFYRLWLDSGMTYSSGMFAHQDETLEPAQERKYERVLEWLDASPGDRLLEIGFGWGGLVERAAQQGLHVTGLTLSREQLAYARVRLQEAGHAALAELRYQDYRDATESFDRIASIEMIEAVGAENWPIFFTTLRDRLKAGGIAVLQAITIGEAYYDTYRRKPDFIQRYVFPGGMLPTVSIIREEALRAGLTVDRAEHFGQSYALTLARWRERFEFNWHEIRKLGFDERFRRLWTYYLTYCAVGFEEKRIDVGLYRLRKGA